MSVLRAESLIKILTVGSITASVLLIVLLSLYHSLFTVPYVFTLFGISAAGLAYLVICLISLKVGRVTLSAKLIVFFYYLVAVLLSFIQGITSPISLLLFCFYILVGGILMGSTYIVKTTYWSIASLFILQLIDEIVLTYSPGSPATISGVTAYSVLFGVFALVGWLAASQIERALNESRQAKAEILHQKELLTQALASEEYRRQQLQVEELNNLHQFAELGQQTTLLLHEFANQLTTLSMDIDDATISSRRHARATLEEMNHTVQIVREKLNTHTHEAIAVSRVLTKVIKEHKAKVQSAHIKIHYKTKVEQYRPIAYGDHLKLQQILNVLIDNAIQAYEDVTAKRPGRLNILLATTEKSVSITVTDYGVGISKERRAQLFKPSHTTKVGGHGIGLYIAKRIIEHQFQGSLELSPVTDKTEFVVSLRRID